AGNANVSEKRSLTGVGLAGVPQSMRHSASACAQAPVLMSAPAARASMFCVLFIVRSLEMTGRMIQAQDRYCEVAGALAYARIPSCAPATPHPAQASQARAAGGIRSSVIPVDRPRRKAGAPAATSGRTPVMP